MSNPVTAGDEAFLAHFESCELPESEWTHLAHVRVAWVCLNKGSVQDVQQRIRNGILRYNTDVLHRRHKYHETVTTAYTRIIADRMRPGETWIDFAARIDDLLSAETPLLLRYYSKDRLFSDAARSDYLEPDLEEIPFLAISPQRFKNG